jgi:hypothetical protein
MRHLLAWAEAAGTADGPLFRAVLKGRRIGGALDAGEVGRVFKAMARQAGLSAEDAARISGHSTRVGAAQDTPRYGKTLPAIMRAGRWKTAERRRCDPEAPSCNGFRAPPCRNFDQ